MDSHPLLDNVQYFLSEIVGSACGERDWTIAHVHDGYRWATYVEQVYKKLRQNDHEGSSANKLIDLILKNNSNFTREEIVGILEDPVSCLNKLLLQNPYLDEVTFSEILNHNAEGAKFGDNFKKDLWAVAKDRATAADFLKDTKTKGITLCDHKLVSLLLEDSACDRLSDNAIGGIISRSLETRERLSFLLDTLMSLHQSAQQSGTPPRTSRANGRLKLLADKLADDCFVENKRAILLAQDPRKLANIASGSFAFYKKYVNLLGQETDKLERDTVTPQPTWKSKSDGLSYQDLVVYWRHLMHGDRVIAATIRGMLEDLRRNSNNEVWDSLISAIV